MEWLKNIRVPGVIWALLLVAVAWFLAGNYPNEVWYPLVIVVITALVKAIEVRLVDQLPPSGPAEGQLRGEGDSAAPVKQHRVRRWFVG